MPCTSTSTRPRRSTPALIVAGLLFLAACVGTREEDRAPTGDLLVRFAPGVTEARRTEILDEVGGTVEEELSLVPGLFKVRVKLPLDEASRLLEAHADVLYAHPDHLVFPTSEGPGAPARPPTAPT